MIGNRLKNILDWDIEITINEIKEFERNIIFGTLIDIGICPECGSKTIIDTDDYFCMPYCTKCLKMWE